LSSKKGDTTTVDSSVNPEITHEHIRPVEKEEIHKNVTQEHDVHHYQSRVQPVTDSRVQDTKHVNQSLDTEHVHHDIPKAAHEEARLRSKELGMENKQNVGSTERSTVDGQTNVQGFANHHIHETIQPVVERETVQPTAIHTTRNVHEHITDGPVLHDQTIEKPISVDEFKSRIHGGTKTATFQDKQPNEVPTDEASTGRNTGNETSGRNTGNATSAGRGTTGNESSARHTGESIVNANAPAGNAPSGHSIDGPGAHSMKQTLRQ